MDMYHSRLTQDDINDLVIKYKIPCDLHPRLPLEEFVMSELPDDAIGIYHRMFDFSGVRIPFSLFLLALIKHYKVHFSQLGPLCLNKVITFEVLCRSLQIEPTVTLFRVFQTLCKQGEWFSFAKHRAPSLSRVCDSVLWGADGNVMGIYDFLCLPEWTGAKVQEEPYLNVRPTLQRLPFYCTPHAATDAVIPNLTLEDLAVGTPSSKILAKAEASQKRKASTSGATSSHVAKRTRSALAQSSSSTTRPSLFVGDSDDESDGDDDACFEILLVTPIRFATVIPSLGNHGGSSIAPTAEGSNTRDSRGKGIMADDAAAPSVGVSRSRPTFRPVPSFRDVFGDAIHADFFSFSAGPYYATYPEGDTVVYLFPTPGEMVRVESLYDDQLTAKMSVLHCMMMLHGDELLARYRGLNQSHHEYVLSADSRLKGYEEKVASLIGLELQAKGKERKQKIKSLTKSLDNLHAEVARLSADLNRATVLEAEKDEEILYLKATPLEVQSELLSLAASVGFERELSMHQTKDEFADVLKKMTNLLPGAQDRLVEASLLVAQTNYAFLNKISKHATEPLSVILQLEPKKLARPANVPTSRDAHVSPSIAKESTVTPASKSLELSTNVAPAPSVVALEQNEEWVNAMVDGPDAEMTDGAALFKSGSVFMQGISYVLDDVAEVTAVGSERVSSGPTDVVVALSVGKNCDGSLPSFAVDEETVANPSRL
ncbi:hypothetical protein Tco_0973243 [Tanacetum coccineum]